jgi:integrase
MGIRRRAATWHYQFQWQGRTYFGTTGLEAIERNRKAAKEIESRELAKLKTGVARFDRILFPVAAAEFVTWLREVEYRDRKSTAERYIVSIASMIELWTTRTIESLCPGDVEQYKAYRLTVHKVRGITLRHDLDALSILNRYCRKMKWTAANWLEEVKKPSGEAVRMHILTEEEESAYFMAANRINADLHDLGRLCILQGCRHNSEVLTLRREDVDLAAMELHIRKQKRSDRGRTLNLMAESAEILERRMKDSESKWIFPSERKAGQHLKKLQASHDRAVAESGVNCVMYDWRHTFATRFAAENPDPYRLAAILGHKGLRSIMCYVHVQAEAMKEGMDKFEAARNRRKLRIAG